MKNLILILFTFCALSALSEPKLKLLKEIDLPFDSVAAFTSFDGYLWIAQTNGNIKKCDANGDVISTLKSGVSGVHDILMIQDTTWILSSHTLTLFDKNWNRIKEIDFGENSFLYYYGLCKHKNNIYVSFSGVFGFGLAFMKNDELNYVYGISPSGMAMKNDTMYVLRSSTIGVSGRLSNTIKPVVINSNNLNKVLVDDANSCSLDFYATDIEYFDANFYLLNADSKKLYVVDIYDVIITQNTAPYLATESTISGYEGENIYIELVFQDDTPFDIKSWVTHMPDCIQVVNYSSQLTNVYAFEGKITEGNVEDSLIIAITDYSDTVFVKLNFRSYKKLSIETHNNKVTPGGYFSSFFVLSSIPDEASFELKSNPTWISIAKLPQGDVNEIVIEGTRPLDDTLDYNITLEVKYNKYTVDSQFSVFCDNLIQSIDDNSFSKIIFNTQVYDNLVFNCLNDFDIKVIDMKGITQYLSPMKERQINMSFLKQGIYLLQISQNKKLILCEKIIKM